jgi:hypothetical protein
MDEREGVYYNTQTRKFEVYVNDQLVGDSPDQNVANWILDDCFEELLEDGDCDD